MNNPLATLCDQFRWAELRLGTSDQSAGSQRVTQAVGVPEAFRNRTWPATVRHALVNFDLTDFCSRRLWTGPRILTEPAFSRFSWRWGQRRIPTIWLLTRPGTVRCDATIFVGDCLARCRIARHGLANHLRQGYGAHEVRRDAQSVCRVRRWPDLGGTDRTGTKRIGTDRVARSGVSQAVLHHVSQSAVEDRWTGARRSGHHARGR